MNNIYGTRMSAAARVMDYLDPPPDALENANSVGAGPPLNR